MCFAPSRLEAPSRVLCDEGPGPQFASGLSPPRSGPSPAAFKRFFASRSRFGADSIEISEHSITRSGAFECRDTIREVARLVEKSPPAVAQVEKLIQDWSEPVRLDRAVRLALQSLDREGPSTPNTAHPKELLSALLLATGERAAEHETAKARRGGHHALRWRPGRRSRLQQRHLLL